MADTSLRGLSAEQHARLREHLALIPVYVWLIYGWYDLLRRLPVWASGPRVVLARDFVQFYVQGAIARQRDAQALYDIDLWAATVPRLIPDAPPMRFPPIYVPQISMVFAPFTAMPYRAALATWICLTLAIWFGCGYAMWKACPRLRFFPTLVLLTASPALHFVLTFTQISALGLLLVTAAFLALRSNRKFLAGVAIGSLIYKPALGLAAAVLFVGVGEWIVVLGALTAAAVQFLAAVVFFGPSVLNQYAAAMIRLAPQVSTTYEPFRFQMHSWRSFFQLLGIPEPAAFIAYAIAAAATLIFLVRCWRGPVPFGVRYSIFLIATILVDPHVYAYDLVLLMPAFLLLWNEALECHSTLLVAVLYVCYFSPLVSAISIGTGIQPSVVLFGATMVVAIRALKGNTEKLVDVREAPANPRASR